MIEQQKKELLMSFDASFYRQKGEVSMYRQDNKNQQNDKRISKGRAAFLLMAERLYVLEIRVGSRFRPKRTLMLKKKAKKACVFFKKACVFLKKAYTFMLAVARRIRWAISFVSQSSKDRPQNEATIA